MWEKRRKDLSPVDASFAEAMVTGYQLDMARNSEVMREFNANHPLAKSLEFFSDFGLHMTPGGLYMLMATGKVMVSQRNLLVSMDYVFRTLREKNAVELSAESFCETVFKKGVLSQFVIDLLWTGSMFSYLDKTLSILTLEEHWHSIKLRRGK